MSGVTVQQVGQFFWCTITAPGEDVLPWDPGACRHAPEVACSGALGCVVDAFDAAVWNGRAPRRWSDFVLYLRRRLRDQVQYFGVWEDQKRGVLHRHFLLRVERPTTLKRVRAAVRGAARDQGFGSQSDVQAITGDAARQAWYCAKYATKTADSVDGRMTLNPRTGELRDTRGFRPWSCSRQWGDSMKSVRVRQRAFAAGGGAAVGRSNTPHAPAGAAGVGLDPNWKSSTSEVREGPDVMVDGPSSVLL